jgi:hypothetical protein
MTQRPDYLRYLESAKQAEVAERLRAEGFTVETGQALGDVSFDLVARKGSRSIAYEFKAGRFPKSNRADLERLQRAAKRAGWEFHIVVVNPPPRVHVEIDNLAERLAEKLPERLAEQLHDHMANDSFPDELDTLSTHTRVDGVSDLEISEIHVGNGEIRVGGIGSVDVELKYGSGSDDIPSSGDSFPFDFKVVLSPDGHLKYVEKLNVDTTSFYE